MNLTLNHNVRPELIEGSMSFGSCASTCSARTNIEMVRILREQSSDQTGSVG